MNHQDAISKAARLLRLARSDNPHEAALAAAKAQEIIDRYKLSGVDLAFEGDRPPEQEEQIRSFEAPLEDGARTVTWRIRLATIVARANQCDCYTVNGTGRIKLLGRPSDAETVRYLYAFLVREIDRLAERDARGNGRTWANNYRLGAVTEVSKMLAEQRKRTIEDVKREATAASTSAIVRVEQSLARMERQLAEVDAWGKQHLQLRTRRSSQAAYDYKLSGVDGHKAIGSGS